MAGRGVLVLHRRCHGARRVRQAGRPYSIHRRPAAPMPEAPAVLPRSSRPGGRALRARRRHLARKPRRTPTGGTGCRQGAFERGMHRASRSRPPSGAPLPAEGTAAGSAPCVSRQPGRLRVTCGAARPRGGSRALLAGGHHPTSLPFMNRQAHRRTKQSHPRGRLHLGGIRALARQPLDLQALRLQTK